MMDPVTLSSRGREAKETVGIGVLGSADVISREKLMGRSCSPL